MKTLIYFDQDLLKIACSKTFDASSLSLLAVRTIKNFSEKDIALEIKNILKKAKLKREDIVLDLPRHLATIKNVELPTVKPDEAAAMIEFQVTRLVPYPKAEIVFDYQHLKTLSNHSSLFRVVIIPRKVLERYLSILALALVYPSAVYLSTESLGNILPAGKEAVALLEIDFNQTHVTFLKDQKVQFSRNISLGSRNFLKKGEILEPVLIEFLSELEASIVFFPVEQGQQQFEVFMTGASSVMDKLIKPIEDRLKTKVRKLELSVQVGTLISDHLLDQISLASILSLLKSQGAPAIFNLLPQDIRSSFESLAYRLEVKRLFFLVLGTILLGVLTVSKEISLSKGRLKIIKQEIQGIEKKASELEELKNKINAIKGHMEHRADCLKVVSTLLEDVASDISIKTLGYDSHKITLRGYATSLSKVFEFVSVLEKNPAFKKIDTKYARQDTTSRSSLSEFHLEVTLAPLNFGEKFHA